MRKILDMKFHTKYKTIVIGNDKDIYQKKTKRRRF